MENPVDSSLPTADERPSEGHSSAVVQVLHAKVKDLGGMTVGRVLPALEHQRIGPFIFFDHMGPAVLPPGVPMNVRPHPHINLATVTYLFDGEILHRDSLGSLQAIQPGAINWMTAGRGIVHSERSSAEQAAKGSTLHGIQLWIALPVEHEEVAPDFTHYPASCLPTFQGPGVYGRILAGTAWGQASPVRTLSPLFYVEVLMDAGAWITVPEGYEERAAYVVEGAVTCEDSTHSAREMLIFSQGPDIRLQAQEATRVMLLGGASLPGPRHIWWNFVSSSLERIEQAKRDWREGRFPKVPGDELEFIPLPEH